MKLILQNGKIEVPSEKGVPVVAGTPLGQLIEEVVQGLHKKIPNADIIKEAIEDVYLTHAEFTIAFKIKGQEELVHLTVQHHEQPEMMTVVVDIDEKGNIKEIQDNDDKSLYTDEMVHVMTKKQSALFNVIESQFTGKEVLAHEYIVGDFVLKLLTDEADPSVFYKQYYQKGKLIQEVVGKFKDNQTIEDLIAYHNNLIV